MNCTGEYVIDDADHDGAILFRFLSTRFREKAAQSSQGSYGSKPVFGVSATKSELRRYSGVDVTRYSSVTARYSVTADTACAPQN